MDGVDPNRKRTNWLEVLAVVSGVLYGLITLLLLAWALAGDAAMGARASLGQLLVDLVLLPVVVVGFYLAWREFRAATARPLLDVGWHAEPEIVPAAEFRQPATGQETGG